MPKWFLWLSLLLLLLTLIWVGRFLFFLQFLSIITKCNTFFYNYIWEFLGVLLCIFCCICIICIICIAISVIIIISITIRIAWVNYICIIVVIIASIIIIVTAFRNLLAIGRSFVPFFLFFYFLLILHYNFWLLLFFSFFLNKFWQKDLVHCQFESVIKHSRNILLKQNRRFFNAWIGIYFYKPNIV